MQRVALILSQDVRAAEPGIEAVRECEIDETIHAADGDRRLRAESRQRIEALPLAAGQYERLCAGCKPAAR